MIEGTVSRIATKTGQGKRGPWTKYSVLLVGPDGSETWANPAKPFEKPPVSEGQYVKCQTTETTYGPQVTSWEVVEAPKNSAPSPQKTVVKSAKDEFWEKKEEDLVYRSAMHMGLDFLDLYLKAGGELPKTATKKPDAFFELVKVWGEAFHSDFTADADAKPFTNNSEEPVDGDE